MWIVMFESSWEDVLFIEPTNGRKYMLESRVKDPEILKSYFSESISYVDIEEALRIKYAVKKEKKERKKREEKKPVLKRNIYREVAY